jgi:hypothetical protein
MVAQTAKVFPTLHRQTNVTLQRESKTKQVVKNFTVTVYMFFALGTIKNLLEAAIGYPCKGRLQFCENIFLQELA